MTIGVLAVQGAFLEHEEVLGRLGVSCVELRNKEDLKKQYDGIILPGGESTVQGKLLHDLEMFETIKRQIVQGMPVLATCAGMILLAETLEGESYAYFRTIPMTVKRNAYGRQLGSFYADGAVTGVGTVPMTFIRAPYVAAVAPSVEVLAEVNGRIVAVRYQNQIALAFHPELHQDMRLHETFLKMV